MQSDGNYKDKEDYKVFLTGVSWLLTKLPVICYNVSIRGTALLHSGTEASFLMFWCLST